MYEVWATLPYGALVNRRPGQVPVEYLLTTYPTLKEGQAEVARLRAKYHQPMFTVWYRGVLAKS